MCEYAPNARRPIGMNERKIENKIFDIKKVRAYNNGSDKNKLIG